MAFSIEQIKKAFLDVFKESGDGYALLVWESFMESLNEVAEELPEEKEET